MYKEMAEIAREEGFADIAIPDGGRAKSKKSMRKDIEHWLKTSEKAKSLKKMRMLFGSVQIAVTNT